VLCLFSFAIILFDMIIKPNGAPFIIYIVLKICKNQTNVQSFGIIKTSLVSILLTCIFMIISFVPFILGRYLTTTLTVNSSKKVVSVYFLVNDCVSVLMVVTTVVAVLYISASGVFSILLCLLIHIVWGMLIICFSRSTLKAA
jgi:hypothetical protein